MKRLLLGSFMSCMLVGHVNSFVDESMLALDGSLRASGCGFLALIAGGPILSATTGIGLSYAAFSRILDRRMYGVGTSRQSNDTFFSHIPSHYPKNPRHRDVYDASRIVAGLGITAASMRYARMIMRK